MMYFKGSAALWWPNAVKQQDIPPALFHVRRAQLSDSLTDADFLYCAFMLIQLDKAKGLRCYRGNCTEGWSCLEQCKRLSWR